MIDREREIMGLLLNAKEDLKASRGVAVGVELPRVYALQAVASTLLAIAWIMIATGKRP